MYKEKGNVVRDLSGFQDLENPEVAGWGEMCLYITTE